MKKIAALLTALALILGLCACAKSTAATWREQYDLGVRYLSEGNYREAIIAFNAAIEIDPKRADAYIGLADAYEAQGDVEQARQVLEEALTVAADADVIRSRLDMLETSAAPEPTPRTTVEPTQVPDPTPGSSPTPTLAPMPVATTEPTQGPAPTPGTTVEPTREPDPTPGATPAPTAGGSQTAGTPNVTITATGIRADSAVNYDGYGSLKINGDWWDMENPTPAQLAVIDRNGTLIFPYREDPVGDYFNGDAQFKYSDGTISLVTGSAYNLGAAPQYFNLNGAPAFTLENTDNEYTDEDGTHWNVHTSYSGSPMRDGYAVVIRWTHWSWSATIFAGIDEEFETLIIDRNGKITCVLPQEFNEEIARGAAGVDFKMSLGWCGEGLFAFFENSYEFPENGGWIYTSEGKGYMDSTGKTVIDLDGRGFYGLGTFNDGLACVTDASGKYGFIDKTGALVIPCQYDYVNYFSDGLCGVGMSGKYGYIDKTGKVVIPFEYDAVYGAGAGLAAVVKDGKCGLVDYNNNVVVPLEYDDISSFEGGVAYAIKDGFVYIIS